MGRGWCRGERDKERERKRERKRERENQIVRYREMRTTIRIKKEKNILKEQTNTHKKKQRNNGKKTTLCLTISQTKPR